MTKKKKNLIINIFFYTLLIIIYGFVTFGVITKFTGGRVHLGSMSMDVVLTDSMSYRNKDNKDLDGTSQIQPFDIVVSHSINESTELNVKDVVLFRSKNYNYQIVCHRIIAITQKGKDFTVINSHKDTPEFASKELLTLDHQGFITLDPIPFSKITVELYTRELRENYLIFQINKKNVPVNVETEKLADNLYHHYISYEKTDDYTYGSIIGRSGSFEHYISSITYESNKSGNTTVDSKDIVLDETGSYKTLLYTYELYTIRPDTSTGTDGDYKREDLISKVTSVIPKLGHLIHFLQSIPGIIMMVGLAIIVSVGSYLMGREDKKNKLNKQQENGSIIEEEAPKEVGTPLDPPKDDSGTSS